MGFLRFIDIDLVNNDKNKTIPLLLIESMHDRRIYAR